MDFLLDTGHELELALYEHYRQLSGKTTDMVFYDITSSYFESDYAAPPPPAFGQQMTI